MVSYIFLFVSKLHRIWSEVGSHTQVNVLFHYTFIAQPFIAISYHLSFLLRVFRRSV